MIKTIVFDFGDVFLTLDKSATENHLKTKGITELDKHFLKLNASYEKGETTTKDFIHHYTQSFNKLTEEEFILAWNSMLIDLPSFRLDFLKNLKATKKYKLILLSNTNELHINWVKTHVEAYREFYNCFDEFYLSHEINLRKPDETIFDFVLEQNNIQPNETLFVDDTLEHITTAKKMGIHTWHLQAGKEEITELFTKKAELF